VQSGPTLIAGRPQKLFDATAVIASGGRAYDIAPDGRFLIVRSASPEKGDASPNLVLVQHWFEELKRLEPVP
jgi:hypothetical protein